MRRRGAKRPAGSPPFGWRPARGLLGVASVAVATVGLAACGLVSPAPAASTSSGHADHARPSTSPAAPPVDMAALIDPPTGKYFGVEANGAPDSLTPVQDFADLAGRQPDLIGQYVAWGTTFDAAAARSAWSYNALYYVAWEPFDTTVAAIANGDSNGYITSFAEQIKAAGIPVALSFGHEMNGDWYPWGITSTSPQSFVAAWRLIHALFAAVGATNVIWIWNPNVISATDVPLEPYYPGNSYVDWIGLTGYFPMYGPTTFNQLFGASMAEVRTFTRKPFIIAETSVQTGPSETGCVRSLVRGVEGNSDVLGFVWFEYSKAGVDWSLASRPAISDTLAKAMATLPIVNVTGT